MTRIRTIEEAYREIRREDENSSISKHYIRQLVITGEVPSRKAGTRYLLNMDKLEEYLNGETGSANTEEGAS